MLDYVLAHDDIEYPGVPGQAGSRQIDPLVSGPGVDIEEALDTMLPATDMEARNRRARRGAAPTDPGRQPEEISLEENLGPLREEAMAENGIHDSSEEHTRCAVQGSSDGPVHQVANARWSGICLHRTKRLCPQQCSLE